MKPTRITKAKQVEDVKIVGDAVYIDISTHKFPNAIMICDKDMFEYWRDEPTYGRICACIGFYNNYPYAKFNVNTDGKQKGLTFHSIVYPEIDTIDHINRVGLDNRRCNLRDGSGSVNRWNQGAYKNNTTGRTGTVLIRSSGRYRAQISHRGVKHHLGVYDTVEEASARYNLAVKRRWEGLPPEQF